MNTKWGVAWFEIDHEFVFPVESKEEGIQWAKEAKGLKLVYLTPEGTWSYVPE